MTVSLSVVTMGIRWERSRCPPFRQLVTVKEFSSVPESNKETLTGDVAITEVRPVRGGRLFCFALPIPNLLPPLRDQPFQRWVHRKVGKLFHLFKRLFFERLVVIVPIIEPMHLAHLLPYRLLIHQRPPMPTNLLRPRQRPGIFNEAENVQGQLRGETEQKISLQSRCNGRRDEQELFRRARRQQAREELTSYDRTALGVGGLVLIVFAARRAAPWRRQQIKGLNGPWRGCWCRWGHHGSVDGGMEV